MRCRWLDLEHLCARNHDMIPLQLSGRMETRGASSAFCTATKPLSFQQRGLREGRDPELRLSIPKEGFAAQAALFRAGRPLSMRSEGSSWYLSTSSHHETMWREQQVNKPAPTTAPIASQPWQLFLLALIPLNLLLEAPPNPSPTSPAPVQAPFELSAPRGHSHRLCHLQPVVISPSHL